MYPLEGHTTRLLHTKTHFKRLLRDLIHLAAMLGSWVEEPSRIFGNHDNSMPLYHVLHPTQVAWRTHLHGVVMVSPKCCRR